VIQACRAAVAAFVNDAEGGWAALPFFADGSAAQLATELDRLSDGGTRILPVAADMFAALRLTAPEQVRVVILGQDPYPTPGDAHGLAFSVNPGAKVPRSLANIFKEMESDLGLPHPGHGDLSRWAKQGVLLLNTCLTVEAGNAGSHRKLGWQALTDQIIVKVSRQAPACAFLLWGADAQAKRGLIAGTSHLILDSPHPSPLSARRGFFGSRPFSRTNQFLVENGLDPIIWDLGRA
jgi:uracil-DNA glycosylase